MVVDPISDVDIDNDNTIGKWEDIREELCVSNVIQRDSVMFASKLHPCLMEVASANEKEVSRSSYIINQN